MGSAVKEEEEEEEEKEKVEDIVEWFQGIAESAGQVQTETLRRIIEINHGTEYLQKWLHLDHHRIKEMDPAKLESLYTSLVPLVSHADLDPYIQRIADGDSSPLLTRDPITMLSLSSGTTDGRPKYVPFTRFSSQSTLQICRLAAAFRSRAFPTRAGGRILEFIYSSKQFETKGGIKAGTATTHYFASDEFKTKQKMTKAFTCSPYQVICGGDYKQTTYCHLLLGLLQWDQVELVASTFAYSIVQALAALEDLWEEICGDIRDGSLSPTRVTGPHIRAAVLDHHLLSPNPALASEVESKCRQLRASDWSGVIPRLWPNAKYVYSIMTGSMLPYHKKLRHYAGDDVPLVCADYGSTESWIGVNLEPSDPPETVAFTVIPTFSYFEFIPLSKHHLPGSTHDDFEEGDPLPLSRVRLGEQHELVLTTFTGLYRCRLGDVVEVSGFYKGAPQLTFICRRKLILTVNIDKNTERDLQLVVEKGWSRLVELRGGGARELVDFTSHADVTEQPGHYIIYWEMTAKKRSSTATATAGEEEEEEEEEDRALSECCREMDLAFVDHGYVVSRRTNSIGPLELRIVETGTFRRILDYYIANGAAMSQFKTPRCTANQVLLTILDRYTIKHFNSTAYSHNSNN